MHEEKRLIKKIKRNGDKKAADQLVNQYYSEIYAFVYRQTTDVELAMDLTQEIFIAVLKGITKFDEKKAGFRTWIYKIASNKITDYYRSRYHRQQQLEVYGECLDEVSESYDIEENIIQTIYDKQMIQNAMKVVVKHGNEWVRIFQMKVFLDKTFNEIAIELNLPENTVKTRYYTMMKKLREEMKK